MLGTSPLWCRWGPGTYNPVTDSPLHFDYHVQVFETRPTAPGRLYIGSDGGLISTDDFGQTFLTGYNTALANLQFESAPNARPTA
jgi:hypothetical protein